MKQGYITYYEGFDDAGRAIFNGNHFAEIEYDDHVDGQELLDSMVKYITNFAQSKNTQVTRVVIKNMFKL